MIRLLLVFTSGRRLFLPKRTEAMDHTAVKYKMPQCFSFDDCRALQLIRHVGTRRLDCYELQETSFQPSNCAVTRETFQKITFDFDHCEKIY